MTLVNIYSALSLWIQQSAEQVSNWLKSIWFAAPFPRQKGSVMGFEAVTCGCIIILWLCHSAAIIPNCDCLQRRFPWPGLCSVHLAFLSLNRGRSKKSRLLWTWSRKEWIDNEPWYTVLLFIQCFIYSSSTQEKLNSFSAAESSERSATEDQTLAKLISV